MKKETKKKIDRVFKWIFWVGFASPFIAMTVILSMVWNGYYGDLPTFEELESPKSNTASDLIADDGSILGQYYVENRSFVEYDDLSPNLVNALVSTEDARFTSHSGIDFISLSRVAIKTVLMGDNQGGGSTITQQLAKNLFPRNITSKDSRFERIWKTVIAKLKEWITAVRLESNYTKEEIIVMYLNTVSYGSNAFGIKSAAQTFFNKLPSEVTIEEAAMLIGVVNAPTAYNPILNPERSLLRRNVVIRRMASNKAITQQEYDSVVKIPIILDYKVASHVTGVATYFRMMVRQYMNASEPKRSNFYLQWDYEQELNLWKTDPLYGWCNKNKKADGSNYDIYRDGIRVFTTLNPKMQRYAEEAMTEHLSTVVQPSFDAEAKANCTIFRDIDVDEQEAIVWSAIRQSERYKKMSDQVKADKEKVMAIMNLPVKMRIFSYKNELGVDTLMSPYDSIIYHKGIIRSSFVAMDPTNGNVKAYIGGNNFRYFQYDMVRQGKRQVGSTIKPFIYTFAIDHLGYDACTPVANLPVTVDGWSPEDGTAVLGGELRPLWWGLAKSRNNYSAWIIKQSNYKAMADMIHRLGIRSYIDPVPSMCLGPSDITLYEMAGAYTTFVNGGVHVRPNFVTRIEDKFGNVISSFTPITNEAISSNSASTITSILEKVVDKGTAVRLRWTYNFRGEMGGKTGTTNNGSDAWYIGITPKLVAGCWVGGENRSIYPEKVSEGSRLALPIYALFLKKVYADEDMEIKSTDKFVRPNGFKKPDCADLIEQKVTSTRKKNFFQ